MKILFIIFTILFLITQYELWIQPGNLLATIKIYETKEKVFNDKENMERRNVNLNQEIQHITSNDDYIEYQARQKLNMVKKGETFFRIQNKEVQ